MSSTIGDLFYGFQKDPIKALKIGAVISVIDSICMIPFDIASVELSSVLGSVDINKLSLMLANGSVDNYESLAAYNVFYSTMMKFYLIMLVIVEVQARASHTLRTAKLLSHTLGSIVFHLHCNFSQFSAF